MVAQPRVTGFTLIELLISISVMSMVIGISTYAFALYTRHWDGQMGSFDRAAGQLQRLQLLSVAIRDSVAWLVVDEKGKDLGFYFLGRDEGMTFVTESPIFDAHGLAVIRVFREREGRAWRLVYEEAPLDGVLLRKASQVLPFSNRLVLLRGLSSVKFEYFGWSSRAARLMEGESAGRETQQWFSDYDGIGRQHQPSRIAIQLGDRDDDQIILDIGEKDEEIYSRAVGANNETD